MTFMFALILSNVHKEIENNILRRVQTQLSRVGFGLQSNSSDLKAFHNKVRDSLKNYMNAGTKTDLVFAPEFTSEERAVIHKYVST